MVPGELRHCVAENPGLFADMKCLPKGSTKQVKPGFTNCQPRWSNNHIKRLKLKFFPLVHEGEGGEL